MHMLLPQVRGIVSFETFERYLVFTLVAREAGYTSDANVVNAGRAL